ncbi:hypothetical protein [Streptomyces hygroscopicus]|uniref:hypothetical protein n=1 Tax=Streptomyces hygroscopicus TaxID=1912 RepID=UPI0007C7D270|nr:hypothetical protein [Streptomyces hygroscopicus]
MDRRYYLLVVSDRVPLGWILSQQRTAFPAHRSRVADQLQVGDKLVVYTTRGCFHNPTRDRGRVVAEAELTTKALTLVPPVRFGEREFTRGCGLRIDRVAPLDSGPILADLAGQLHGFPTSWATHIRRTLVPLAERDFALLQEALAGVAVPRREALQGYLDRAKMGGKRYC